MLKRKRQADLSDMDLRLLRVFNVVAEAGSFTAAEIKLNKSKSAISTDIAALETRLGVRLCRRGRSGFALTPYGKEIHAASLELFDSLSSFREHVGKIISRIEGEFTVALDDNFVFGVRDELVEVLRAFNFENPNVFLSLRTTSAERVSQLVLDGTADVGVSVIPRIVPEVTLHPLFTERMTLYCGARHPLFAVPEKTITADVISEYDCVDFVTRQTEQIVRIVERMKIRARAATVNSRLLLVLTGKFLGFLPEDFARNWELDGDLRALCRDELYCDSVCFAITRRDAASSAARERFLEKLSDAFGARKTPPAPAAPKASPRVAQNAIRLNNA